MSNKISRVKYLQLRREEQHTFNDNVLHIMENTCGDCGKPYQNFRDAARRFDQLLQERAPSSPVKLSEYDDLTEDAWSYLNYQIKASLGHPDMAVREAAVLVSQIFRQTPNPATSTYAQKYGAMKTLLSQLDKLGEETLEKAFVKPYLEQLRTAVQQFIRANAEQIDNRAQLQSGQLKEAVTACYKAWQDLAIYLEAMSRAETLEHVEDAIAQLNILNNRFKAVLSARNRPETEAPEEIQAAEPETEN